MATRHVARSNAISAMTDTEREHALGRLQGELYCSANGVAQQAQRLRENKQPGSEYMADGRALAYFLRDTIRLAQTCVLLVDNEHGTSIEEALARVEEVCPDAVNARDALEHCDDYVLGIGFQQSSQPGDYAQRYSRDPAHLVIRVGDLTIDVDLAERAALHLASVALAGSDPGLLPVV